MRYSLLLILLVVVVSTAGCVGETSLNLFKPTPTPIPPNYGNCNGTWYDSDNQTCCGDYLYTKQDGFGCWQDKNYRSINDSLKEAAQTESFRKWEEEIKNEKKCACYEDGHFAYYWACDLQCINGDRSL